MLVLVNIKPDLNFQPSLLSKLLWLFCDLLKITHEASKSIQVLTAVLPIAACQWLQRSNRGKHMEAYVRLRTPGFSSVAIVAICAMNQQLEDNSLSFSPFLSLSLLPLISNKWIYIYIFIHAINIIYDTYNFINIYTFNICNC